MQFKVAIPVRLSSKWLDANMSLFSFTQTLLNTNRGREVYEFLYELDFVVSFLRIRQQGSTYDTITSKGRSIARLQKWNGTDKFSNITLCQE